MRAILIISLFLVGCATDPSVSRDRTAEQMARAAIIGEMLKSQDPVVRNKGADAADKFVNPKRLFDF